MVGILDLRFDRYILIQFALIWAQYYILDLALVLHSCYPALNLALSSCCENIDDYLIQSALGFYFCRCGEVSSSSQFFIRDVGAISATITRLVECLLDCNV